MSKAMKLKWAKLPAWACEDYRATCTICMAAGRRLPRPTAGAELLLDSCMCPACMHLLSPDTRPPACPTQVMCRY